MGNTFWRAQTRSIRDLITNLGAWPSAEKLQAANDNKKNNYQKALDNANSYEFNPFSESAPPVRRENAEIAQPVQPIEIIDHLEIIDDVAETAPAVKQTVNPKKKSFLDKNFIIRSSKLTSYLSYIYPYR